MRLLLPLLLMATLNDYTAVELKSVPLYIGNGQMPAFVSDAKGNVHLIYGSSDSLFYSGSKDAGKSFSKPELIKVIDGLAASATRGPQIVITRTGLTVVASTDAGNILSYTRNGEGNWSTGKRVNDVDSVNLEGFVDVASDGDSNLFAVWLDLRGNKRNKLYGSRSADGGKTWLPNIKVYESPDSTICECCRVSVVRNGSNVYVMFRNQLYGKRDLHLIRSQNGGRSFGAAEKLGTGTWALRGCPMDGGDIALTSDGKIQTVWRRESKIFSCEPGKPEIEIGEGKNCTLANVNGKNIYAWVKNGEVICKLSEGNFKVLGKGNSPVLKSVGNNQLLCVWENDRQLFSSVFQ